MRRKFIIKNRIVIGFLQRIHEVYDVAFVGGKVSAVRSDVFDK